MENKNVRLNRSKNKSGQKMDGKEMTENKNVRSHGSKIKVDRKMDEKK